MLGWIATIRKVPIRAVSTCQRQQQLQARLAGRSNVGRALALDAPKPADVPIEQRREDDAVADQLLGLPALLHQVWGTQPTNVSELPGRYFVLRRSPTHCVAVHCLAGSVETAVPPARSARICPEVHTAAG